MAFIIKKKIHDKEYYYLNENRRVDGKVKTKTLAYLGKNKKEAERKAKEFLDKKSKISEKGMLSAAAPQVNFKKPEEEKPITIEDLATFCKRKGFVFRSSEIYGGFAGFWDFGPLGAELFKNIKDDFWKFFVTQRDDMVGIEASIISHPKTWKASGHLDSFSDVAVICKKCKNATKLDKSELGKVKCEKCGGDYESQGEFNLLFKTNVSALDKNEAYLRGETAQAMFMDFKLVQETSRKQLPFGIVQIGKVFRNEIAPRDFLFRGREFTIGEFEFFIYPEEKESKLLDDTHKKVKLKLIDAQTQERGKEELRETTIGEIVKENKLDEWHAYWLAEQLMWFDRLGLKGKIKVREHMKSELSHYSSATFDIDYEYPFGSKELAGNANRGQYDLTQHIKESRENLEIFDENTKKKVIPRVIEPTFGMERIFLALIVNGYEYNKSRDNVVLKLPPFLAPIKAAVFPIVKGTKFEKISEKIVHDLKKEFNVSYDKSGSIGRRYARNDEIGTPFCITIDTDSLKNEDVTVRLRDTTEQVRIKISNLKDVIRKGIGGEDIRKLGKIVDTRKK